MTGTVKSNLTADTCVPRRIGAPKAAILVTITKVAATPALLRQSAKRLDTAANQQTEGDES
jgi:hypothetical protein